MNKCIAGHTAHVMYDPFCCVWTATLKFSDREMYILFGYNTYEGFVFYLQIYSFG